MSAIAKYGPPALGNLPLVHQGKSRDTFQAQWPDPNDKRRPPRLIAATKRISTHNVVHESLIPKKDEVLTGFVIWWFIDVLQKLGIAHHVIAYGKRIYDYLPGDRNDYPKDLHHRAIVVKSLDMILIEFIFRAYLDGSLWKDYYSQGLDNPYGMVLPMGLSRMTCFDTLPGFGKPIFTPTDKSDTDDPLLSAPTEEKYPKPTACTRQFFNIGRELLHPHDLECVDKKDEVGIDEDGVLTAADEGLTPDSSRFTRLSQIKEGVEPEWADKQIARNKAEEIWAGGKKVPLIFPPLMISNLTHTYVDLFEEVVGMSLSQFQHERLD